MTELRSVDGFVQRALDEVRPQVATVAPSTIEALEVLVRSAREQADLNGVGRQIFESWIDERLANRLRVEEHVAQHPASVARGVERPLIVLGQLRTGTTILLELLAADAQNRPLMKWEALDCLPPPRADTFTTDARIEKWVDIMEATYAFVPELKAVHWEPGDGPTECVALLGQSFRSQDFSGLFHVPDYVDWYLSCDFTPAYEYHRTALQLLQSEAPGRWVLKAPGHMLALDALLATYPDACLVMTHRDPHKTVASSVSLSTTSMPNSLTESLDTTDHWGSHWLRMLGQMVDDSMAFRDRRPDVDVYDLSFRSLVDDPIGAVAGIYDHFGDELAAEAERAMVEHLASHPRGAHGRHEYSLADAGLLPAAVDERFAAYTDRFGVLL